MNEKFESNNIMELDELVVRFDSDDPKKRIEFINQLTAFKDSNSLDFIIHLFDDKVKEVRLAAIRAAGEFRDPRAVTPLKKMLMDKHGETSKQARDALCKIFERSLKDNFSDTRADAAEELGRLSNPRSVEPLMGMLDDTYSWVREASAWALGEIGDNRCVEALIKTLKDDKPLVRRAASKSLGRIKDEEASSHLIRLLKDPDCEVREASVWALGELGSHEIITTLRKSLKDSRKEVRVAAAESIGKIKTRA